MKKLLILSGKGGTGKTTTAAAFVHFSQTRACADCDVDAPNLHLVTQSQTAPAPVCSPFFGMDKAVIHPPLCTGCGMCMTVCRFGAIVADGAVYTVRTTHCEGCGVCQSVCPQAAISLAPNQAGFLELYQQETRTFSSARLKMGQGNSGKLVTAVKNALEQAHPETPVAIYDGSPGIGCPVMASMSGMDLVLIVAEPSLSGIHDMKRIAETARISCIPIAVCINKYDMHPQSTAQIQQYCEENDIPFVGQIPYDRTVHTAINAQKSVAEFSCPATTALQQVYQQTLHILQN